MIVRYTGPRRGGISQIGTVQVSVAWDVPVELPDTLAQSMLDQYPDEWEEVEVDKPKPTKSAKAAPTPDESPEGEEVHLS